MGVVGGGVTTLDREHWFLAGLKLAEAGKTGLVYSGRNDPIYNTDCYSFLWGPKFVVA